MKVLFLGGIFDESHNDEIISKTRTYVEYAANNFQKKIIEGLKLNGTDIQVVSAPFLGAYPKAYRDSYFNGFDKKANDLSGYSYAHFINVWGVRNPSRKRGVINLLTDFIELNDNEKLILVYTPHTPFIQAANYAKRKDPNIKICLIIPDLPQYMNLSVRISPIYKLLKRYDVKLFMRESRTVDTYVLLTEQMAKVLEVGDRPYVVVEGIYEGINNYPLVKRDQTITNIVYTGRLEESFGIVTLIDAFKQLHSDNLRLIICGSGEAKEYVEEAANQDKRILYKGQVSSSEARKTIIDGDILVNPRQNNSEYTKFSFPSKIIDYMSTGNPVVAYKLDGMPKCYTNFIYCVPDNTVGSLAKTIQDVIAMPMEEKHLRSKKGVEYLKNVLSKERIAKTILELNGFTGGKQ